ncbi:MAG: histidinol dehydrogenase [Deltaproteobacteria bacterium]|nr:histidinol dehydrogenase [Deltaproteobacteria bacterium]
MAVFRAGAAGFEERLRGIAERGGAGDGDVEPAVREILADVRRRGDAALVEATLRFDRVDVGGGLEIGKRELREAEAALDPRARRALRLAARRIRDFHRRQVQRSWRYRDASGLVLGQKVEPLERVGVYVPGGRAAYPSSVLMNVIPAKVAGVGEVIAVSPPSPMEGSYPAVLAAASIAGVDRFFRVGGAQAVAALAHGTETVPRVDKIVGPGNVYVQTAKRLVFGRVGIDNFAAASEVLVVADGSARPEWVAADLLSQAEHDEMASAVCVTPSAAMAEAVAREVGRQLAALPRRETAERSLGRFGGVFVVDGMRQALEIVNTIAPEHLELSVEKPEKWLAGVRHAGAVFLGEHAPEALGDYVAGPNHVLPTGATARFGSPLGVYDFVKRMSIIGGAERALRRLGPAVVCLAELEGLEAHARSVKVRLRRGRKR